MHPFDEIRTIPSAPEEPSNEMVCSGRQARAVWTSAGAVSEDELGVAPISIAKVTAARIFAARIRPESLDWVPAGTSPK